MEKIKKGTRVRASGAWASYGEGVVLGRFSADGKDFVRVRFFSKVNMPPEHAYSVAADLVTVVRKYANTETPTQLYHPGDVVELKEGTGQGKYAVISYTDGSGIPYAGYRLNSTNTGGFDWFRETQIERLVKRYKNGVA